MRDVGEGRVLAGSWRRAPQFVYKHSEQDERNPAKYHIKAPTWIHVLELRTGTVPAVALLDDALEHVDTSLEERTTRYAARRRHPSRSEDAADLTLPV